MTLSDQILLASHFAAIAHETQLDKGLVPYIQHPMRVAFMVCDDDKPVALLHDVLEDCDDWTPLRLLEAGVDPSVVIDVVALTKGEDQTRSEYEAGLLAASGRARRVKVADITDNLDRRRPFIGSPVQRERYERLRENLTLSLL